MQCALKCAAGNKDIISPPYTLNRTQLTPSPPKSVQRQIIKHEAYKMSEFRTRNRSYRQALGAILEDTEPRTTQQHNFNMSSKDKKGTSTDFVNPDQFSKATMEDKLVTLVTSLNKLHTKIDTINTDLHKEEEGFIPRFIQAEVNIEDILDENEALKFEVGILKGLAHRQQEQILNLNGRVDDLVSRQMSDNILISGLIFKQEEGENAHEEDCVQIVKNFFTETLKIQVDEDEILNAHRIGSVQNNKEAMMVVRCLPRLRDRALQNSKKLKDITNDNDNAYYINRQVPESHTAERKDINHTIKKVKETNKNKPPNLKQRYQVRKRTLFINDKPVFKQVRPPTVLELFPEKSEQERMNKIKLSTAEPVEEEGSIFTAVAVKVNNIAEVKRTYRRVKQLYPNATHIPMAYDCQKKQGNHDDNEHSAGLCLQKVIEQQACVNKAVFVVRNYGGKRLGTRRFALFTQTAQMALAKVK